MKQLSKTEIDKLIKERQNKVSNEKIIYKNDNSRDSKE